MVNKTPTLRRVRKEIQNLAREVQHYEREPLDQEAYRAGLSVIHTDAVTNNIHSYITNAVLGDYTPSIAAEELRMPRQIREVLAQLR